MKVKAHLERGVELSAHSNAELSTVLTEARMNSRLWFRAYVSDEQVSKIIAPVLDIENENKKSLKQSSKKPKKEINLIKIKVCEKKFKKGRGCN